MSDFNFNHYYVKDRGVQDLPWFIKNIFILSSEDALIFSALILLFCTIWWSTTSNCFDKQDQLTVVAKIQKGWPKSQEMILPNFISSFLVQYSIAQLKKPKQSPKNIGLFSLRCGGVNFGSKYLELCLEFVQHNMYQFERYFSQLFNYAFEYFVVALAQLSRIHSCAHIEWNIFSNASYFQQNIFQLLIPANEWDIKFLVSPCCFSMS
jgi:hypothetical protein